MCIRDSQEIMAGIFLKLQELYRKDGGVFPDPILNLTWRHRRPEYPSPEELAKEFSGMAVQDLTDPKDPAKVLLKAGQQLNGFAELRDDGSTACGCWIFSGAWPEKGNLMARRDNSDPYGIGQTLNWAFSWPANRRILYNRASCDVSGKPFDPKRLLIAWDAGSGQWKGADVPDFVAISSPEKGMGPFIMNPEGVARFFAVDKLEDGPFPEHYEPLESPLAANLLHPKNGLARANPAARVFKDDWETFGNPDKFPHVCTTYRLTEHFHFWTKHARLNAILQPEQFVEIGEELAGEKGIKAGDHVRVKSNRGFIVAVAVVTKRLRTLEVGGKKVHTVGVPIHWGFTGVAKNGYIANTLTPFVGDANTQTPEFKSFLVNLEKV
jgi:formate dehydrogenase major subunit